MTSSKTELSTQNDSSGSGFPQKAVLAVFCISIILTLPSLLILGLLLAPEISKIRESQKEIQSQVSRLEQVANLIYFSRDPEKTGLDSALAHFKYWSGDKVLEYNPEVTEVNLARAEKAILVNGRENLDRIEKELLSISQEISNSFRKRLLKLVSQMDPSRSASIAKNILLDPSFPTQSRIFAVEELLLVSRDEGVKELRKVVTGYTHKSMPGYWEMLRRYLQTTTDPARGKIAYEILRRPLVNNRTLLETIKGVAVLTPTDPFRRRLGRDLENLYFRDDLSQFKSPVVVRPLMAYIRRDIIRSLGEILAKKDLLSFIERTETSAMVDSNEGIRALIQKIKREKCF